MSKQSKQKLPTDPVRVTIESLTHDGRGVAHLDGKTVFVQGAFPGEEVDFVYSKRKRSYDEGVVKQVIISSPHRIVPRCPHFGVCGGCSLQFMDAEQQISAKQQVLLDNLKHIGNVTPEAILPPVTGPHWGYRRKARLGVKYVTKKGRVLVGFRERQSRYLADLSRCEVLDPSIGNLISKLSELIGSLQIYNQIPQIEVAVGDDASALVFRHLVELLELDIEKLREFGQQTQLQIYLQPAGPDSVTLLYPDHGPDHAQLSYRLPEYNVEIFFDPVHFTQVNAGINQSMVRLALELLDLDGSDRVLDLFCGLGNFTLPIARYCAHVTGVEGDKDLVQSAIENAVRNKIENVDYYVTNLMENLSGSPWMQNKYDKILLDPPRSGAYEVIKNMESLSAKTIVYVSCNPATLARDAGVLVNDHGYRLMKAGVMDMFPHTTHVESIALFRRR
jgi:23S rRNA (uracil1939-C5)-methyltransferase